MRRASRSSSVTSGKLALEPLRVCWARLGRTSFAPLGEWVGSRPSSSPVSVQPRSHARCALRRARRADATPPLTPRRVRARARACAAAASAASTARARHGREEQRAERDRFALHLLDRHDAAAPRAVKRHLLARAPLRAPSRAHACTRTHTARHLCRLQRSRLGAPRATPLPSVARARGRRLRRGQMQRRAKLTRFGEASTLATLTLRLLT
jgi:hypothetical protein